jgi:tetratricopeptide (TPR) repeat protein
VLGLLCKPSAAAVPLLAAVLSLAWLRRGWHFTALWLSPWLILVAVSALLTRHLQTDEAMLFVPPRWARPLIAADALQFYLLKLCVPTGLAAHYDRSPQAVMSGAWFVFCWIGPALLAALLLWRPRREGMTAAGLFIAALLPVLGLVPFGYQDYSTVADRYAYLALFGAALLLAAWLAGADNRPWKWTATVLILAVCAGLSFVQTSHWRNTETLFAHNLQINPRSEVAHDNLASYLIRQRRPAEALEHAEETLRINPRSSIAQSNRGSALEALGRKEEALEARRLAVQNDPSRASAHIDLGNLLAQLDRLSEAEAEYREALAREPESMLASFNLGRLLQRQQRDEEAMVQYRRVLARHPNDYKSRLNLGLLLTRTGRFSEAGDQFAYILQTGEDLPARVQLAEALVAQGKLAEAFGQYRQALAQPSPAWPQMASRAAWLLATHPDQAVRDGRQAVKLAQEACRQTKHQRPEMLRSLAAAYAETGQFDQARQTAEQAVQLARRSGSQPLVESLEADLRNYREGLPIREME